MACGESMKVLCFVVVTRLHCGLISVALVDYILFMTADVTVTPNANEIRDHKYVDKAELQAMFDDQGMQNQMLRHRFDVPL